MKKFIYVFAVALMGLVACNCGAEKKCAAECAKECCVAAEKACAADCVKACCATEEAVAEKTGCQVEGGTCLADHSCCAPAAEKATCCCGDAECDGSCHADADTEESHEGHDHD